MLLRIFLLPQTYRDTAETPLNDYIVRIHATTAVRPLPRKSYPCIRNASMNISRNLFMIEHLDVDLM